MIRLRISVANLRGIGESTLHLTLGNIKYMVPLPAGSQKKDRMTARRKNEREQKIGGNQQCDNPGHVSELQGIGVYGMLLKNNNTEDAGISFT